MNNDYLEKLLASRKYRDVCPDTIRRVWSACSERYKKPKEADKAAREALHGITGAFLTQTDFGRLVDLADAWDGGDEGLSRMLSMHASTRERLPLASMDALAARLFQTAFRPKSVLDLACGLNPIYLAARVPEDCRIVGLDINGQCVSVIRRCPGLSGRVTAVCADLLCEGAVPRERFDMALMFKVLPLLERQRTGAALDVMSAVNAAAIVASFPTRTMGGRNVGMAAHYAEWMERRLPENREIADRFETDNELFYVLKEK